MCRSPAGPRCRRRPRRGPGDQVGSLGVRRRRRLLHRLRRALRLRGGVVHGGAGQALDPSPRSVGRSPLATGERLSVPFAERAGERRGPGVAALVYSDEVLNASNTINGGLIVLAAEEAVLSLTPGASLASLTCAISSQRVWTGRRHRGGTARSRPGRGARAKGNENRLCVRGDDQQLRRLARAGIGDRMQEQRRGGKLAMDAAERDAFLASERTCRWRASARTAART